MRGRSHIRLGQYLIGNYMKDTSRFRRKLFLIGCIQPDRNPLTYLKGSLNCRWLHGHNYCNAKRFMERISKRLEKRRRLNLWDYYTLGKLIHYTTDAFTYTHNDIFQGKLSCHRDYERKLQNHFLSYLHQNPEPDIVPSFSIMETIKKYHREYSRLNQNIPTDCIFALQASCCVMTHLLSPPIL